VKLVGGLLILWIAVKLFVEGAPRMEMNDRRQRSRRPSGSLSSRTSACRSTYARRGRASHGNVFLLLFGLGLSIPFIVFTSNLLSMLMDKYPVIIYIGAASSARWR